MKTKRIKERTPGEALQIIADYFNRFVDWFWSFVDVPDDGSDPVLK